MPKERGPGIDLSWRRLVAQVIVVLEALGDEAERTLARHGWARVRFGGHAIDVPEPYVEFAARVLRQRVVEDIGEPAAAALDEPIVEKRGLRFRGGLCRGNFDQSAQWALRDLLVDLTEVGDVVRVEDGREVVDIEHGRAFDGSERSGYLSALQAVRGLVEQSRLSNSTVAEALGTLRASLGRSTRSSGSRTDKKLNAIRLAMTNPEMTSKEIAKLVGVHVKTLTNRDRWGPEMERARAQGRRDQAPDAADEILGSRGRRLLPKAGRPEIA